MAITFFYISQKAGLMIGDFLVAVGDRDVKWAKHDEVVKLIRDAGLKLALKVVTPLDRNYIEPSQSSKEQQPAGHIRHLEAEMAIKTLPKKEEKTGSSWTLRRKGGSKEKQSKNLTNGDR